MNDEHYTEHDFEPVPPIEDADWKHPVDLLEPELATDAGDLDLTGIGKIPTDALRVFVMMMLPSGKPTTPAFWKTACSRLAVLAHALGVEPVAGRPLAELAAGLGCSRAILSLYEVRLRDFAHLGHRAGKSDAARAAYSARARRVWQQRHQNADIDAGRATGALERKRTAIGG